MTWMNEYEIAEAYDRYACNPDTPNLAVATATLARLCEWTNRNSDGWPYWRKPTNAAKKLTALVQSADRWEPQDVTEGDLKRACAPIKSFLTREGVPHSEVFP